MKSIIVGIKQQSEACNEHAGQRAMERCYMSPARYGALLHVTLGHSEEEFRGGAGDGGGSRSRSERNGQTGTAKLE